MNLGTITFALSWYKFSPLSGIRVKPKLHRRRKNLRKFPEPSQKPKVINTDNLLEFSNYCEELSWNHRTTTLRRSETSGIAERAVRRAKEETAAVLLQSASDEKWESGSMKCCCYLRDVQKLLADGKSPHERRFGESFEEPIVPLGSLVESLPNSERDKARIHQVGKKVLPGIFTGHALLAGGV